VPVINFFIYIYIGLGACYQIFTFLLILFSGTQQMRAGARPQCPPPPLPLLRHRAKPRGGVKKQKKISGFSLAPPSKLRGLWKNYQISPTAYTHIYIYMYMYMYIYICIYICNIYVIFAIYIHT